VKLTVYFTPLGVNPHDIAGRPVLVIDVLRATTTVVAALAHGARAVLPVASGDEALRLAKDLNREDVLLAGERGYRMIEGFAFGNSPQEVMGDKVKGMTLIMSTSNGTPALLATDPARPVLIGAAVNFSAAAAAAKTVFEETGELVILCAGQDRRFALEDAYTAGRFAREILPPRLPRSFEVNDAAIAAKELVRHYGDRWKRAFAASSSARKLHDLGLDHDVAAATEVDRYDIVPSYAERQVRVEPRG
jgi:2-phosphosulfolactate phosphatase